jgi:hypothetical protein
VYAWQAYVSDFYLRERYASADLRLLCPALECCQKGNAAARKECQHISVRSSFREIAPKTDRYLGRAGLPVPSTPNACRLRFGHDTIAFAIEQPADVDVNEIVVRPTA